MLINDRIREFYNWYSSTNRLTQKEFSEKIDISTSQLSSILNNRDKVGLVVIEKFLNFYPELNANWLLKGEGKMLANKDNSRHEEHLPKVVTVDSHQRDNIVLVPAKAAAGYPLACNDPVFISELPSYHLPNLINGTFRMFQIEGHSMFPTLHDKSYVVGEWVENWIQDIKDNQVYVVVIKDGVLVKRAINRIKKYNNILLKSDNRREYPNLNISPNEIIEVWKVKMHLSFELPDPSELYDRMNDFEAELEYLKKMICKK
jgi:phage repressor protein C with HTH and peptisase S24 domain